MGNKLNKENESKGEHRRAKKKDTCCKIHSQKQISLAILYCANWRGKESSEINDENRKS